MRCLLGVRNTFANSGCGCFFSSGRDEVAEDANAQVCGGVQADRAGVSEENVLVEVCVILGWVVMQKLLVAM